MPTFCPVPRIINEQECIGESLPKINENYNLLARNICNTSTMLDSLSYKVDNITVTDTSTIDFTYTRNIQTNRLGQINNLTGFVKLSSISSNHLGVDIIPAGRALVTQAKLNNLTDVNAPSPLNDQVLKYNTSLQAWIPQTDLNTPVLSSLLDVRILTRPQNGQVLKFNTNLNRWIPDTDINYPTLVSLLDTNINTSTLPQQNGYVLKYNASGVNAGKWTPQVPFLAGTGINLGSNGITITHSPHTGDVAGTTTLSIQPCAVRGFQISFATNESENAARAINQNHIRTGSIITRTIGDQQVTNEKLANFSVNTVKLADQAVTTEKIAINGVRTNNILDTAVVNTKLALSPGFSVKGRSPNALGAVQDIIASDNTVLCKRPGPTQDLKFQKITVSMIEDLPQGIPSGAIMAFAYKGNIAPSGWLWCDGQIFFGGTYPTLFAVIGTYYNYLADTPAGFFRVPDLRGYFIRGWGRNSDGSGQVDENTNFGYRIADTLQSHNHSGTTLDDYPDHPHNYFAPAGQINAGCGKTWIYSTGTTAQSVGANSRHRHDFATSAFLAGARVGTETMPRNIPLLYCIKI